MAAKAYADGSMHNVLPFPRNAPVEHPRRRTPLDVTLLADYEVLRDDLKKLNADFATLKRQLGSLQEWARDQKNHTN